MLAKKCFWVGIFTLLSVSLAIANPPAVHPATGKPLVIDCLRGTPDAIDGDLSDWNLEAMTPAVLDTEEQIYPNAFRAVAAWDSPADSSGEFYVLWDDVNIYMAVVVKDDTLSMNKSGGSIWNADCVEILFSTTNAVDSNLPYMSPEACAEHYQYGFNANNQRWNWCNMDGTGQTEPDYLQIASSETADGYICEVSIEYRQMPSLDFSVGNTIGFHPVLDDTDNGNIELHMTWTGLAAHDQSLGFGHMVLSDNPVVSPDIAALEEGMDLYALAMTTGDLELYLSLHTDDTVKMAPDAPAVIGKKALRASMEPFFDAFTIEDMAIFDVDIQVAGNWAFSRCNFTATMIPKAGGEPLYVDAKDMSISKRQADGSWKIYWDCWNSNVPPAQQ